VAMRRLADDGRISPGVEFPNAYMQFTRSPSGISSSLHTVDIVERPPLSSVLSR
jgi:hypothetical protein